MTRRETVNRDRARMARRALTKAGYLVGNERDEDLTREVLEELAIGFMADVFHLMDLQDRENRGISGEVVAKITYGAKEAYHNDSAHWP